MTKMMISNLPCTTTVASVTRLFAPFGTVRSASLAVDVMTGRCSGFGFVHLEEPDIGRALDALNGKRWGNRVLLVTLEQKSNRAHSE